MDDFNCTKCKNNPTGNSFATFKDGHIEPILYFRKYGSVAAMFVTQSGVYVHNMENPVPAGLSGLIPASAFFRVMMFGNFPNLVTSEEHTIESVTLDDRIEYKYLVTIGETSYGGTVRVAPEADDTSIESAILESIGTVEWAPNEED